jgi:hypothetical protein
MKKKLATLLAAVMLTSMISTPVSAASYVTGNIGDISVSGRLVMDSNSAIATTSSSTQAAAHHVSVIYTYGFGLDRYTVSNSAFSTYCASATASSDHYGSVSLSASGTHRVDYNQYSWRGHTSI